MEQLDTRNTARMERATSGLDLTGAEEQSLKWLCGWEPSTVENIASVIEKARESAPAGDMTRKDLLTVWGYLQALKDIYERKAKEATQRGDDLGRELTASYMKYAAEITTMQRKIDKEANKRE